jgi:26S proteasome regulatory subunit N7
MTAEEEAEQLPDMNLAQLRFKYSCADEYCQDRDAVKAELLEHAEKGNMSKLYESMCQQFNWPVDAALLEKMNKANAEELKTCNETLEDAETNLGDMEILEALFAKAKYYTRIGDKDGAMEAYKTLEANDKIKISTSQKIQIALNKIRIAIFHNDVELVNSNIGVAEKLVDLGGDWDRRNRLKVYKAVYSLMTRDLKTAASLFLDSVASFTCTELCTYNELIFYTVITSVLCMDRLTLRKRVVDSPEVLSAIKETDSLADLLNSLYNCRYKDFFAAMVNLHPTLVANRYFSPHCRYIVREYRVLAYSQFLQSYKSVTLAAMAKKFGVSVEFCDQEISRFIAAGRLHAKIDKIAGVVETMRPDTKNAHYKTVIKEGDALLNRIQKLARVVNV